MLSALLLKEWIKLRFFIAFALTVLLGLIGYFYKDIAFQFATIEPENMMWYRFTFLYYKKPLHEAWNQKMLK